MLPLSHTIIFLWLHTLGCNPQQDYGICDDICKEVYSTCQFAAYPSYQSCVEGCAYNEEQGADIDGQFTCIQEASCDEFAVVECENTYGANSNANQ